MSKRPGRRHMAIARTGAPEPFTPLEIASTLRDAYTTSCWPVGGLAPERTGRLRQLALVLVERLGADVAAGSYSWAELVNVLTGAALAIQTLHGADEVDTSCLNGGHQGDV